MKHQIWVATGKSTELDPVTTSANYDTSWNNGPFLNFVVNEGQRQVAKWKNKETGRPIRINDLVSYFHYSAYYLEDTIISVNNDTDPYYVTLTSSGAYNGEYEGWVMEVTSGDAEGEILYIYSYEGSGRYVYFSDSFTNEPAAGDTVKLYKRFELLLPSTHTWVDEHISVPIATDASRNTGNMLEILSVVDVTNRRELVSVAKTEKFPQNIIQKGDPSFWYRYGNAIYYDKNVDEKLKFRVEYYRSPTDMVNETDEPDIPSIWHTAIVLWGRWYVLMRKMEAGLAYAAKMDFEDEMRRTISEFDMKKERIELGGTVLYDEE
jgi:hypothetical protein